MPEYVGSVLVGVLVEEDAAGFATQKLRQPRLTLAERPRPQIFAIAESVIQRWKEQLAYRALLLKAMGDMCRATRLAIMGAVVSRNFLKCAVARCASKAVSSSYTS